MAQPPVSGRAPFRLPSLPNAVALAKLGLALRRAGRLDEGIAALRRAAEISPREPNYRNLAAVLGEAGRMGEAVQWLRKRLAFRPVPPGAPSDFLYAILHDPSIPPGQIFAHHRDWGQAIAAVFKNLKVTHDNYRSPGRRLRLGYVSPDFREHANARFVEPVVLAHDRSQFEVYCYSDVLQPDEGTQRFRQSADGWRDIRGQSDEQVATLIRRDKIDILIDTTGHMERGRMALYARSPAPIQVSLPIYPGTTGLPMLDYFITDSLVDPPGLTDHLYVERLIRLEGIGRCYRPDEKSPPTIPLPADANGFITFGAFNRMGKVTDAMLGPWAEILANIPGSRLQVLVEGPGGENTCPSIRDRFARFGLTPENVQFMGRRARWQYLEMLAAVDICLDTFPYNGCTTTCDSLWMGTPVVTLRGTTHVSRVAHSFLSQVGLPDLSVDSPAEYIVTAIQLANDRDRLRNIRASLRERMGASSLTDAVGYTRRLEALLRTAWREWCRHDR